jgi:pSer/pThr/pTyr-binding forkhead associated (FHA) protein
MAKLTVRSNEKTLAEHELDKEEMTLGRKSDNDIQIDDQAVSGHHARILTILNDSFLEDQNSTNGTYVNGSLVKKHALHNGDVIAIGKHMLTFTNAEDDDEGEHESTMIIRPDATGMPAKENTDNESLDRSVNQLGADLVAESEQQQSHAAQQSALLRVVSGANAGQELQLTKALTTLGKPGVQVAAVTRRADGFYLIQVEGAESGHPTVNGQQVGTEAVKLEDKAVIDVAGVKMEFVLT